MTAKQIIYGDDARQKLLSGATKLASAVVTTLGPRGRNVAIDKKWGGVNILVNNAATAINKTFLELSNDDWQKILFLRHRLNQRNLARKPGIQRIQMGFL